MATKLITAFLAALTAGAPKDESGCSRGGLCRHQANCGRLNCAGHPRNNIGRHEDDEIHRPGWGHPIVLMFVAGFVALATGIVLVVRWLT